MRDAMMTTSTPEGLAHSPPNLLRAILPLPAPPSHTALDPRSTALDPRSTALAPTSTALAVRKPPSTKRSITLPIACAERLSQLTRQLGHRSHAQTLDCLLRQADASALAPPPPPPPASHSAPLLLLGERLRAAEHSSSFPPANPNSASSSDAPSQSLRALLPPSPASDRLLRCKQKAKERKREIVRLREEIKLLRDGFGGESEPPVASCRCHFFEGCGEVGPQVRDGSGDEHWIDNVLRRRFIRLVRWKERTRRIERPIERKNFMEFESEDEVGRLSISIDFLVELSDKAIAKGEVDSSFSTFSHQAVDFILASLKNILVSRHQRESLEEITNGLIMRLIKRMCTDSQKGCQTDSGARLGIDVDPQFCVQHLIRKLGKEEFVGQRVMLSISQKITIVAENLLLFDPFHENFVNLHGSMFLLIQLMEFMISDYITSWLHLEQFEKKLFEEWVRSILKARKDLETLANMNGLYILYMDRVVALLAKEVGPAAHRGKLDPQVFSKLLS